MFRDKRALPSVHDPGHRGDDAQHSTPCKKLNSFAGSGRNPNTGRDADAPNPQESTRDIGLSRSLDHERRMGAERRPDSRQGAARLAGKWITTPKRWQRSWSDQTPGLESEPARTHPGRQRRQGGPESAGDAAGQVPASNGRTPIPHRSRPLYEPRPVSTLAFRLGSCSRWASHRQRAADNKTTGRPQ